MTEDSVFGQIIVATEIEQAVADTLKVWFPAYLKSVEYQLDIPRHSFPVPRTYSIGEELDLEQGMPTPSVVVVSPGLSGRNFPKKEGDGTYRVFFNMGVGVIVEANNRPATRKLVRIYTGVIRAIMMHKSDMRGLGWSNPDASMADGIEWLDESWDDAFPFQDNATISAGQCVFELEVAGVVSRYGGPADPNVEPDVDWGLAQKVTATVVVKED